MLSANDDFFAALDAEIGEHLRKSKIVKNGTAARQKASTSFATAADRADWHEQREAFEVEIYQTVALVALFAEQTCDGCGSIHYQFLQFMERQTERSKPNNRRLRRVTTIPQGVPRETLLQKSVTHLCSDCCAEHGFALDSSPGYRAEPTIPPRSYHPDDINALEPSQ